jgi:hypothetical protein
LSWRLLGLRNMRLGLRRLLNRFWIFIYF